MVLLLNSQVAQCTDVCLPPPWSCIQISVYPVHHSGHLCMYIFTTQVHLNQAQEQNITSSFNGFRADGLSLQIPTKTQSP